MALQTVRPPTRDHREHILHPLPPIRLAGQTIHLFLTMWHDDDGTWRGRLRFTDGEQPHRARWTADIFCGSSEDEVWSAVLNTAFASLAAPYARKDPPMLANISGTSLFYEVIGDGLPLVLCT